MIDARGYLCPTPVIMVQREVRKSQPESLEVLVDDQCAVENVTRFAGSCGYQVGVAQEGRDYRLTLKK